MRLDNPLLVRWEYASEERFAKRSALFNELLEGRNPDDAVFEAVAEGRPARVLDVGCGLGKVAERLTNEVGAEVLAVDTSARMVELTRARGIDASVADAEELPFPDGSFDAVLAGWVLYHCPDVGKAIAECARVLKPGGRLVASSYVETNLAELWAVIEGVEPRDRLSFDYGNGAGLLEPHFATVVRRDLEAVLVFPDVESIRTFVASTIDRAHLAPLVPDVECPFRATTRHVLFVAEKAR